MREDLEPPRVKSALEAVLIAFSLIDLGTRIVVDAHAGPGQVDVRAPGLLGEAPLLAQLQAAFECLPSAVIAEEIARCADGVHRVHEGLAVVDPLRELQSLVAPKVGRRCVLDVEREHGAIRVRQRELVTRRQLLQHGNR